MEHPWFARLLAVDSGHWRSRPCPWSFRRERMLWYKIRTEWNQPQHQHHNDHNLQPATDATALPHGFEGPVYARLARDPELEEFCVSILSATKSCGTWTSLGRIENQTEELGKIWWTYWTDLNCWMWNKTLAILCYSMLFCAILASLKLKLKGEKTVCRSRPSAQHGPNMAACFQALQHS